MNCREKEKTHLLFVPRAEVMPLSFCYSSQTGITIHRYLMPIQASQIPFYPGDLVFLKNKNFQDEEHKNPLKCARTKSQREVPSLLQCPSNPRSFLYVDLYHMPTSAQVKLMN